MNKIIVAGAAVVAILASVMAGYRIGAGVWPRLTNRIAEPPAMQHGAGPPPDQNGAKRAILYWKDPDGKSDFSTFPKNTADGRAYLPVYEDEEADFKEANRAQARAAKGANRKILYYRNPMGLPDTSPVPKKDGMGMDYIPVYEGDEGVGSAVRVSLDRVQRSGVRSEAARMQKLARPVRAAGIAKPDERTLHSVTLRADGFIEKLYVNESGAHVTAGEPMFRVYIPQIVMVQIEYLNAVNAPPASAQTGLPWSPRSEKGALQRLRNYGMPEAVIEQLRGKSNPIMQIDWPAPMTGVVMEKKVVEGQMVKTGDELYRLADLSSIWVIANVAEQDIGMVKIGAPAKMVFRAYPSEVFEGRVTFILHDLNVATRTAAVRIEVNNPEHRIKHEMFADVEIDAGSGDVDRLVVPTSAVIDSGNRQIVLIDKGEGNFEPRAVKLGMRGEGFIEILKGLKAGESVVVTANFLIDAESNLKAALQAFTAEPKTGVKP
jgi:membrane fusion protein, copper/silver efflux system